jgi:hypothetical protein
LEGFAFYTNPKVVFGYLRACRFTKFLKFSKSNA